MMHHTEHNSSDLYLVRHGETAGQSSVRFYGSTDVPLSDTGRRQMEMAAAALMGIPFRTVITSPLVRSREGADIMLDGAGVTPVVVEDFREIDFGDWEGLTVGEIEESDPEGFRIWRVEKRLTGFPGGDSREGFHRRVRSAARSVFSNIELPALAVLHKGVIRGILCELLGLGISDLANHTIELGSIHRLDRAADGWTLAGTNETGHLGDYRMEGS